MNGTNVLNLFSIPSKFAANVWYENFCVILADIFQTIQTGKEAPWWSDKLL